MKYATVNGKVHETFEDAVHAACKLFDIWCVNCPLNKIVMRGELTCIEFANKHQDEAMKLLGIEKLPDSPRTEDNMKARITILTESNAYPGISKEVSTNVLSHVWKLILKVLETTTEGKERYTLENIEILN